jgi:hypothetical protein
MPGFREARTFGPLEPTVGYARALPVKTWRNAGGLLERSKERKIEGTQSEGTRLEHIGGVHMRELHGFE